MRFETEAGYGISEMATAFGDSEKIGQYAVAAASGSDGNQNLCTDGRKEDASL